MQKQFLNCCFTQKLLFLKKIKYYGLQKLKLYQLFLSREIVVEYNIQNDTAYDIRQTDKDTSMKLNHSSYLE